MVDCVGSASLCIHEYKHQALVGGSVRGAVMKRAKDPNQMMKFIARKRRAFHSDCSVSVWESHRELDARSGSWLCSVVKHKMSDFKIIVH